MQSEKKSVQILSDILKAKGIKDIVFSPGSRNAPVVIQLASDDHFNTISIPDERCAAFYAIGISQWTQIPTLICCTSGSAALNYAPAIAEAYYQEIPLIVITADRPVEWIDHGEGQSIRQNNLYANYIKASYQVPQNFSHKDEVWHCNRIVNEAINRSMNGVKGPVHINMPFTEPLYNTVETNSNSRIITEHYPENKVIGLIDDLGSVWQKSTKKMIICGQMMPDDRMSGMLEQLSDDPSLVVLTETTSNVQSKKFCANIDRVLAAIDDNTLKDMIPEAIITIGGAIISKRLKALFREHQPQHHWHIDENGSARDVFQCLTDIVHAPPANVFSQLKSLPVQSNAEFSAIWEKHDWKARYNHEQYVESCAFSDLTAYRDVLDYIPDDSVVHMANSTAVRYVQLFDPIKGVTYLCNRGTSGIDGTTSTALGSATVNNKVNTLITGDMSFLYDSNAFWNIVPSKDFRIIVINNGGGGIFRFIDGPDTTKQLDSHFVVRHHLRTKGIADMYGIKYTVVNSSEDLNNALPDFFSKPAPHILEVVTNSDTNPDVLRSYFQSLVTDP